jgi:hypothetical protein
MAAKRSIPPWSGDDWGVAQVNYAEKQFENAANIERALLGADVFSPGQVAEAILGYDAAVSAPTATSAAMIAALLRGLAPTGLPLAPNHWSACSKQPPAGFLPGLWVSFIVQWKRPERLVRPPVPGWAGQDPPFYRFPYRAVQRDILERLEVALAGFALVRYGAPAICGHKLASMSRASRYLRVSERTRRSR